MSSKAMLRFKTLLEEEEINEGYDIISVSSHPPTAEHIPNHRNHNVRPPIRPPPSRNVFKSERDVATLMNNSKQPTDEEIKDLILKSGKSDLWTGSVPENGKTSISKEATHNSPKSRKAPCACFYVQCSILFLLYFLIMGCIIVLAIHILYPQLLNGLVPNYDHYKLKVNEIDNFMKTTNRSIRKLNKVLKSLCWEINPRSTYRADTECTSFLSSLNRKNGE